MLGRRSKSSVLESPVVDTGSKAVEKAAETVVELAEKAMVAAREAQRVATPALRSAAHTSAETLSHAAEKAAEVLAEAADRLSEQVPNGSVAAKGLAKVSGKAARSKRWRRRFRRMLTVTGVAGFAYVLVTKTPLKAKISELVFGPPLDEDEPEPITLPVAGSGSEETKAANEEGAAQAEKGQGVASGSATQDDGASA